MKQYNGNNYYIGFAYIPDGESKSEIQYKDIIPVGFNDCQKSYVTEDGVDAIPFVMPIKEVDTIQFVKNKASIMFTIDPTELITVNEDEKEKINAFFVFRVKKDETVECVGTFEPDKEVVLDRANDTKKQAIVIEMDKGDL